MVIAIVKTLLAAVSIWSDYVCPFEGKYPRISRAQAVALSAALEYLACRDSGEKAARADLCAQYGISALRFNNALNKLTKAKEKE